MPLLADVPAATGHYLNGCGLSGALPMTPAMPHTVRASLAEREAALLAMLGSSTSSATATAPTWRCCAGPAWRRPMWSAW